MKNMLQDGTNCSILGTIKQILIQMNIFFLHHDPFESAKLHHDRHVVKMISEYYQLISTAYVHITGSLSPYAKPTHKHHPSTIWTQESSANFFYVGSMLSALIDEYDYRWEGRQHNYSNQRSMIEWLRTLKADSTFCNKFQSQCFTPIRPGYRTYPDFMAEYGHLSGIPAYRAYYAARKVNDSTQWSYRLKPQFLVTKIFDHDICELCQLDEIAPTNYEDFVTSTYL